MVKSRKAKAKTSDFQKVKLKIGKRLPKGLNETNASFKSTSIQIKEQLKQRDSSLPHTRKKYTLHDLLPQCNHYSGSVRAEALVGLCELGKASPRVIIENLPAVLEKISGLILDQEHSVRNKVLPLLKEIFLTVSIKQISPFFPLLTAHILCAMTHLTEEIQQDSLPVLDLCLESYPKLMLGYSDKLLNCFIKQIAAPGSKNSEKYALITNPSSRRSSLTWRIQVLKRLKQVMAIRVESVNPETYKESSEVISTKETYNHIVGSSAVTEKNISCIQMNKLHETADIISEKGVLFEDLIPLLVQCWIEAKPESSSEGSGLSQECINMLDSILGIFDLGQRVHHMKKTLCKDVVNYFMPFFPFTMKAERFNSKKKQDAASAEEVNIRMCNILCSLGNDYVQSVTEVSSYIERVLNKKTNMTALTGVIQKLVISSPRESKKLLDKCENALSSAKKREDKIAWLSFFLNLSELCVGLDVAWYKIAHLCVKVLPQVTDVLDNDNIELLDKVLTLINRYTATRRAGSMDILPDFISNLLKVGGVWGHNHKLTQKLVTLMYWLPSYEEDLLKKLRAIVLLDNISGCHFLELLEWRMSNGATVCSFHVYISFLFSLLCCDEEHCHYDGELESLDASKSSVVLQVRKNLNALKKDDRQIKYLHESFHSKFLDC